jgi:hypothetical protein
MTEANHVGMQELPFSLRFEATECLEKAREDMLVGPNLALFSHRIEQTNGHGEVSILHVRSQDRIPRVDGRIEELTECDRSFEWRIVSCERPEEVVSERRDGVEAEASHDGVSVAAGKKSIFEDGELQQKAVDGVARGEESMAIRSVERAEGDGGSVKKHLPSPTSSEAFCLCVFLGTGDLNLRAHSHQKMIF